MIINTIHLICVGALIIFVFFGLYVPELRNDVHTPLVEDEILATNLYFYTNGTNITDLKADNDYLVLNGDVYMKDFALHQYFVFEEYKVVVIPNDNQPKFYFETLSIKRCNEAILIGDDECYNYSYQKLHLFVGENVAFTLQEYGYNYVPDLSNYKIIYG